MRFEIERKFLVANDGWRAAATGVRRLTDGLIGQAARGKARVRLEQDRAWLTVKGVRSGGIARPEFEYEIPRVDAEAMLRNVCTGCLIEKARHSVPYAGLTWEVDVFGGALAGIVLAEVELKDEAQSFAAPDWLGEEVTGDPRFRLSRLLNLCNGFEGQVTMDDVLAAAV
ncbi:CYTH domain-containing protein [Chenggangzhangella methanolivorans]|uniref:CYTH domain-containing protein n=1 Tax=Chenggangzhangella methanolivorans TaxID=1437009 RepID=A0A9E6RI79_9HYPH|nr:CYTH domain-containing protein [Chenggangzhangella methanolivorans]QZO01926.1 CYTH domain-containing protein [Chenggangzhangella methanolivorans]